MISVTGLRLFNPNYSDYSGLYDNGYDDFVSQKDKDSKMLVSTIPGFPDTPIAQIPLQNGMVTLFDPKWSPLFLRHHWYAKKSRGRYYVCCKKKCCGSVHFIRMHRAVAHTPRGMVCHHINGNTLDNREANLQNMTEWEHAKYYSYW